VAEKKMKWTQQQKRAIGARGSDVLVTASAGTGKTAVLSGRCVDIVSDKSVCGDVWSVLVLTFTDAAAEQMRSRIAEQLRAAFLESGDPHLRHQLMLLQGADISTIHSFCKRLITEHFYKLGLDPTFRVIDADEAKLLKAEALERCIDWAWQQGNLAQVLEQLFYRRDLRTADGFPAKIIALSEFLDGIVSRRRWYERTALLAEVTNPSTAELGKKQRQIIADKLQSILNQLRHAQKLYESERPDGDWTAKCEDTFVEPVERCVEFLKAGDWDKCAEEIRNFKRPRVNKPRELPELIAEVIQKTVKKAVGSFAGLSELAVLNPDYLDKVSGAAGLQTKVLVELVKRFDRMYSQAKRAVNCMDFADLEHYALELLADEDSSDEKLLPSETALALRRKYKYIFVDEYQDINPVQEAILDLVSSGGNVFVVGDVKQSIYAFRGAVPKIFLKGLKSASIDPKNAPNGLRVDLNANFRSAKGILDFVNKIFGRIMTCSFADIDYDESAKLRPTLVDESKTPSTSDNKPIVEFHILDEQSKTEDSTEQQKDESADEENLNAVRNPTTISNGANIVSSRQRQAIMIAQRIRQIVGAETGKPEFQIYDKQERQFRDVEYRDIVILMRSLAKKANDYVEVLRLAGVPVSCEAIAGYFEATEISDMLCLLKVLDNPQRDIELAAVLRSPLFKISDTELAKIKIHGKTNEQAKSFYNCVVGYRERGRNAKLAEKLKKVLEQIEQWRTLARRGNLADLIWQVYQQSGFLSFVSALANGGARRANLLKLHERAIQFEGFASSAGNVSLTRFVEFIEKLQKAGQDWSPAEVEAAAGNAVRIMSVHKSKGLEFPVVFLAELDSRFNKRDIQDDCLADAGDTLGLQIIDRQSNSKLRSLAHQVIAEEKLSTALAEEMRILYVATTRARGRLILTASQKQNSCRNIICNGIFFGEGSIADWQLRSCQSPLEWVLYGLCDQRNLHETFETGLAEKCVDDDLFSIKLYGQTELKRLSNDVLKLKANKSRRPRWPAGKSQPKRAEGKLLSQVKKSLAWRYHFGEAPSLPAKLSVTQMTHRDDEYVRMDYSRTLERKPRAVLSAELAATVDGRLIGTATHLMISKLDLAGPINKGAIERIKEKLLVDGAITEAVAERIDAETIVTFFQSELGRIVLDAENKVWREWPFTFALPACELPDSSHEQQATSDEVIIVQGIIDMLISTPNGLAVIDFKTDNIATEEVAQQAELYRRQLELYGRAASAILKTKLLGKWLYFLTPGCAIKI
jgi:ATP-dependent helicase/nuclease subunit A